MKYYILAGEASGDMHAANLMKQLKLQDAEAYFRVWGGDKMEEQADEMARHIRDTSFMGIFNVVRNIRTIKRNFRFCENDIKAFNPDVLILIDNSGFNLRIAKYIMNSKLKTRIFYYILPQAWAWKRRRVHTIQQRCHRIFAILPFEKAFYKSYGYDVDYVGHPILDALAERRKELLPKQDFYQKHGLENKPIIALLPGSRKQEISSKLPIMLKVIDHFPRHQFVVAGSTNFDESFYSEFMNDRAKLLFDETYNILYNADAALVTSGTATLETALFHIPQVVCYKAGYATFHLLKRIIKVRFISMVNLILDREAVPELVEDGLTEERLTEELKKLFDEQTRAKMLKDYEELDELLGGEGASERVADLMIQDLRSQFQS